MKARIAFFVLLGVLVSVGVPLLGVAAGVTIGMLRHRNDPRIRVVFVEVPAGSQSAASVTSARR